MYASKTGQLEVVKILLQKFAKINQEENVILFFKFFILFYKITMFFFCPLLFFRILDGLLHTLPYKETTKMC